jgi:DNA-binding NtrC family response regulator
MSQEFLVSPSRVAASLVTATTTLAAESMAPPPAHQIVPFLIGSTVGEIERELVLQTLSRCNGNRTHAARMLGLSIRTLRNKIRLYAAHGIDVPPPSD